MKVKDIDISILIDIAQKAGNAILKTYETSIEIERKDDNSPLTQADIKSNEVIIQGLQEHYPQIPRVSEENKGTTYEERKNWPLYWLIDPLDGTKEFLKRNGEFTVNIALMEQNQPVMGVIYVPVKETCYYAISGSGTYVTDRMGTHRRLTVTEPQDRLLVVGSRSHLSEEVEAYVETQRSRFKEVKFISAGSSLKFCLLAEGKAHVYPRFGPTMEWDIAAGHIIAEEAGAKILTWPDLQPMQYNKQDLLNPFFIAGHGSQLSS